MNMTRLYREFNSDDNQIVIDGDDAHYLRHVLRIKTGEKIHIFNERLGEFEVTLTHIDKQKCVGTVTKQIDGPLAEQAPFRLIFAPLKQDTNSYLYEKGTELGVTEFVPVITQYAQKYTPNLSKITKQFKSSTQQCERLDLPQLFPPHAFQDILQHYNQSQDLTFIALERSPSSPNLLTHLTTSLSALNTQKPINLITGPEGGFSKTERDLLHTFTNLHTISLGNTILRAETAALVGLGLLAQWKSTASH